MNAKRTIRISDIQVECDVWPPTTGDIDDIMHSFYKILARTLRNDGVTIQHYDLFRASPYAGPLDRPRFEDEK